MVTDAARYCWNSRWTTNGRASGAIWYDADGYRGGPTVAFAQINPGPTLVARDFITV